MSKLSLRPPSGPNVCGFDGMSRRERVFACWLALRRGWNLEPARWSYCGDSDQALVEFQPEGTCTFSVVRYEAERTLTLIEESFGADARRRAEEAIG